MSKHFDLDLIRQMNSLAVGAGSLAVWGLGQMGVAIKTAGQKMVYMDPVLSNVVAETFPESAETFRRAFAAPVAAALVSNADIVLCTHEHLDHADPQTLRGIAQASPRAVFIAPLWAAAQLDEAGIPTERRIAPRVGQPLDVNGLRVWAVPAGHYDVEYDEQRGYRYLSYVLEADGVVLRRAFAQVPARVDYALTDLGRSAMPVLEQLGAWGRQLETNDAANGAGRTAAGAA